jgi:protein-S-isoprenylcysteine O-methyltransferase Ste14
MNKRRSLISISLVLVQFACLGLIGLTGPLLASSLPLLVVELLGLGLGVWAILSMRIGNFNITPDPLKWSRLVKSGPYRLIRHPMYLALLLASLPLVIDQFTPFRLAVWLVLLADLLIKLNYEERLLVVELPGYDQYLSQSYRLIPLLY